MADIGRHFHSCPECYEHVPCDDFTCSIIPDLSEPDRPFGLHEVCTPCVARKQALASIKCEAGGCSRSLPQHPVIKPGDALIPAEDRVVVQVPAGWLVSWSRQGMGAGRMVVLCPGHAAGAVRGAAKAPPYVHLETCALKQYEMAYCLDCECARANERLAERPA